MSAPERLLAGEATDFERELLGSWQTRKPSPDARARTLARLGVGVGAAALALTTAKTAGGSVAPKAMVASSALLKWLVVGAIGASLTAGTLGYVHHAQNLAETETRGPAAGSPVQAPQTQAERNASANQEPPTSPIELSAAPEPAPVVAAPAQERTVAHGKTAISSASPTKSTLDDEVAMVGRARQAEAAGDAAGALVLLNAYDSKYPGGSLARESTEIRILALISQGNRPAAERLAERFIASHPSTLDARNIRRLLDGSPNANPNTARP